MLERAMDRVRAWELLNDPHYSGALDMEGLERLMVRAGFGRREAHETALERGWNRMCAGETA